MPQQATKFTYVNFKIKSLDSGYLTHSFNTVLLSSNFQVCMKYFGYISDCKSLLVSVKVCD